jgi:O-antigen/teichoic acid export membrane protein
VSPDLLAFLVWITVSAVAELLAYVLFAYRLLPWLRFSWKISLPAMRGVWRFSAGLNLIALSAVVLTQLDRLVISKLLTLEALGYYALAFNVVTGLSMIHSAINAAALPNLASLANQRTQFLARYDQTVALTVRATALPCLAVAWFSKDILTLWVGASVAEGAFMATSILMIGLLCNAMISVATTACIAIGRPWAVVGLNAVALVGYVPLLLLLTQSLGTVGAAWSWLALNAFFFLLGLPLLLSVIGRPEPLGVMLRMFKDSGPLLAIALFGTAKCLVLLVSPWLTWPGFMLVIMIYLALSYPHIRTLVSRPAAR